MSDYMTLLFFFETVISQDGFIYSAKEEKKKSMSVVFS